MRYNVHGDAGAWVNLAHEFFQYDMEAPKPCVSLTANLLRDRKDVISDLVELSWVKDSVSPGTGRRDLRHRLRRQEAQCVHQQRRRTVRPPGEHQPLHRPGRRPRRGAALSLPHRGHQPQSAKSSETYAAPINITSKVKPVVPPTPDEVAGTARDVVYAELKAEVFADVLTALGALPTEGQAIVPAPWITSSSRSRTCWPRAAAWPSPTSAVFEAKWTK
jgi:hypothetical protein